MGGWIIRDASSVHRFEFPVGTSLEPGGSVVVFTGCTTRSAGLAWCADGPVWNNGGDTVVVQTPEGTVVDRLRY
jgi:competence protein ComEC